MTGTHPNEGKLSEEVWWKFRPTIEPVMMVTFYLISVSSSPLTDLVMRQSCRILDVDPANCSKDESIDEDVHRMSSSFSMWHMIVDTLPGCVMSLFTSPWSDTNGRKPVIVVAIIGSAMSMASLSYMSTIPDLNPYFLLMSGIPIAVTGGPIILILNSFFYIIDITSTSNRVMRITVLMSCSSIGSLIAQFVAPPLEKMGYDWLFASNCTLMVVTALYAMTLLPESVTVVEENRKTLFTFDHLIDSFNTFFKKRPYHARVILFCLLTAGCSHLLILSGELDIKYLSTIKKFGWTIQDYSTYTAVVTVLNGFGTFSGVFIGLRVFKLTEQMFCLVIMGLITVGSLWTSWSKSAAEFYIASQIRIFSTCIGPVIKSSVSKVVPHDEVSKVIAFQSTAEAFMPQLGTVLYSKFYNLVVAVDPFVVYDLSVLIGGIGAFCCLVNLILYRRGKWDSDESTRGMEKDRTNNENPTSPAMANKDIEANL